MPPLHGILETALYVNDVTASAAFYRSVFGLDTLLESDRLIASWGQQITVAVAERHLALVA